MKQPISFPEEHFIYLFANLILSNALLIVFLYIFIGLPAPSNVHIDSYNMKHIVKWDPVKVKDESMPVMYSVGFQL